MSNATISRGTTPIVPLTVDADISDWTIYVTFESGSNEITLENDRITCTYEDSKTKILCPLTQEETLKLNGVCEIQVRAIKDGTAVATEPPVTVDVGRILLEGVINE